VQLSAEVSSCCAPGYRPNIAVQLTPINPVSDVLRAYRAEHNLSVAELADLLSASRDCVHDLERGIAVPRMSMLRRIARLVDWSAEELGVVALSFPIDLQLRHVSKGANE
jgi:DNA-binding XRE family transcriptional regulator